MVTEPGRHVAVSPSGGRDAARVPKTASSVPQRRRHGVGRRRVRRGVGWAAQPLDEACPVEGVGDLRGPQLDEPVGRDVLGDHEVEDLLDLGAEPFVRAAYPVGDERDVGPQPDVQVVGGRPAGDEWPDVEGVGAVGDTQVVGVVVDDGTVEDEHVGPVAQFEFLADLRRDHPQLRLR